MEKTFFRFDPHTHTEYSNLRLRDSTNTIEKLTDYAIDLGLKGLAITEHECLSGAIRLNEYSKAIKEKSPDFKLAIGNEIYLCSSRKQKQRYYHFILIAKNRQGFEALKELSTRAWLNSYRDRGMERVVTTYKDLSDVIVKYPNSLIGGSACLGGFLSTHSLELIKARKEGNQELAKEEYEKIITFLDYCRMLFGKDFYIEIAPACSKEQIAVNQQNVKIAKALGVPVIIGSDAHYLRKEDRFIHKAFLTSKDGEREVDSFYEYAYLQSNEEEMLNLEESFGEQTESLFEEFCENSMRCIYDKIEFYDLSHTQQIPKVPVIDYPKQESQIGDYKTLSEMYNSDDIYDRYWINQCMEALEEKTKDDDKKRKEYLNELEEEAEVKKIVGNALDTNMFRYPILIQHYIDLIWECGSPIGVGRGSACAALNHYLLGITQLPPLEWNFPFFRYMNRETRELGDVDIDIAPSKRPLILKRIKEERAKDLMIPEIQGKEREELGCTLVATFKTETAKSAIQTAARGYRSKEYPNGLDPDLGMYLSSLIPVERGFVSTLSEVLYGNKDKEKKPVQLFIDKVNEYPHLIDIALGIEGLINGRSSHASGVIMFNENPLEECCFMKTPKGEVITQFDLHDCEKSGLTKIDLLVTSVQDKILQTLDFLREDGLIEKDLSLREIYNKYLHPDVLPLDDKNTWGAIQQADVLSLFQLDSDIGRQGARKIKPTNMTELSTTNGLIRLMAEKGAETPMEKYLRFRENPSLWEQEMDSYGLNDIQKQTIRRYLTETSGIGISQEQLMRILMDKDLCNFSLAEANQARRIISKKKMSKIPDLKKEIFEKAGGRVGEYVWLATVVPQAGYSFSDIHSLSYSFVGFQTAYLATHWNSIYWNTACLIVDSASLEDEEDEETENLATEKSSDYTKIATALGKILTTTKVSLIDINNSDYTFKPDAKNNIILFGLKGVTKLNKETIDKIKSGRPYRGIIDFMKRCPLNKSIMISLIKGGAFDNLDSYWAKELNEEPRLGIMAYYLSQISNLKKKITLQNINGLIEFDILSEEEFKEEVKAVQLNKYFKKNKKDKFYLIKQNDFSVFTEEFHLEPLYEKSELNGEELLINQAVWNNYYESVKDILRTWIVKNQSSLLTELNSKIFKEDWNKYASGTVSSWEMDSICFYFHSHELEGMDKEEYGIRNFFNLEENPIETMFRGQIPIYKISKLAGTVIAKNDTRHSISLLTLDGVVNVKFSKDYYAMYKGQLSEIQEDGKRKIVEKGWFTRGTKLLVAGYKVDDTTFKSKVYKKTGCHQLYKIVEIKDNGKLVLEHERTI